MYVDSDDSPVQGCARTITCLAHGAGAARPTRPLLLLAADPMADYQAPGLVLLKSWEYGERGSFMGSAPNHAEAVRWYRIENQSEVQDRLREAVAYAESVGWQIEQRPTGAYVGQRELGPGMGQVIVSVGAEDPLDDLDGPRALGISPSFFPTP